MSFSTDTPATATSIPSTVLSDSSILIPTDNDEDGLRARNSFKLKGNQILVKVSHVNDVLTEFKTEVFDEEEKEECHFVRIVRIGPEIKKDTTIPGALVVCQRRVGVYLDKLSDAYGETYYLIQENDIMTFIDM